MPSPPRVTQKSTSAAPHVMLGLGHYPALAPGIAMHADVMAVQQPAHDIVLPASRSEEELAGRRLLMTVWQHAADVYQPRKACAGLMAEP